MNSAQNGDKKRIQEFRVQGLVAATFTPFTPDGDLNLDLIPEYADHLVETGVRSVFVNGTTGEWASLTVEERKQVAEAWMWVASRLDNVIIHVGSNCLKTAKELASHAEELGADAIGALAPSFFKPTSVESLVTLCKEIAQSAPTTPFYYYHIPHITGIQLDMVEFLAQASRAIPTLRGIKFSSFDMSEGLACLRYQGGAYNLMYGCDQQLLGAVAMGFEVAVGSTYNYMGSVYNHLLDSFRDGPAAIEACRQDQARANDVLALANKHCGQGLLAGLKEVLRVLGPDVGPARPPLPQLTPIERSSLARDLRSLGLRKPSSYH